MPAALVSGSQGSTTHSSVSSGTINTAAVPTAGNTLALHINERAGGPVTSITDTQGNTWVPASVAPQENSARRAEIWVANNVAGAAATITVNYAGLTTALVSIEEWSGLADDSTLIGDADGRANPTATNVHSANNVTSDSDGVILTAGVMSAIPSSITQATGFTQLTSPSRTNNAYQLVATGVTTDGAFGTGSNVSSSCAIVFLRAVGAPTSNNKKDNAFLAGG